MIELRLSIGRIGLELVVGQVEQRDCCARVFDPCRRP